MTDPSPSDGPPTIGVLVEAAADAATVCMLVDRLLLEIGWMTPELLDSQRAWRGFEPGAKFAVWKRLAGLQQARDDDSRHGLDPERVAVGVANPEREAWLLAGFAPASELERERLASERQRLGFDPTRYPHRLRGGAKRKRQGSPAGADRWRPRARGSLSHRGLARHRNRPRLRPVVVCG